MEGLEALQMVLRNDPGLFKLFADLYAENLPLANNIEIRNRLKTIVPPEIVEAGKTGKPVQQNNKPSPEEMQAEMAMQEMKATIQQKQAEIMLKEKELLRKTNEMNQDAMIELQKMETERLEAAAKLQETELRYQAETQRVQADVGISHADNLVKLLTHGAKMTEKRT